MSENRSSQNETQKQTSESAEFGFGVPMIADKPKDFRGAVAKLLNYVAEYRNTLIVVILFAIASTVFSIVGPKILGQAVTLLYEGVIGQMTGSGVGIDFSGIGNLLLLLTGLYLISSFFTFIQGWLMSSVSQKVTYKLRLEISEKINRLPLKYFDKASHGDVISRITNDVDVISNTLNQSLMQIITSVVTCIGVIVMMLTISWQMTIAAILVLPISFVLIALVMSRSQQYFAKQQEYIGKINGHVEEMYGNHLVIKAFNGEEKSVEAFNDYNKTLYGSAWKAEFFAGVMMPIMTIVSNLGYVVIAILGGFFAIRGVITVGDIQAFIQYVQTFMQPLAQIAQISNILQQTAAASERIFEFLAEEEEPAENATPISPDNIRGEVIFEYVRFGYDPEKIIIKDFSAHIQPGQKIALVGPTGAGKTTIIKLLMRYYDLNSGRILIDGRPIDAFARHDLRGLFGIVLQDTWLYNNTIMENIRYGRLDATDEEVISAAKDAHVDYFVRTLPDGYNTILNEDTSNVSQGQKQLLTIARAILSDPKILILDEATSSVDTRTELLIQKAMDRLMAGRTSFVIAHRLSTIRNADLILVMRNGDIIEQGNHAQLLEQDGFYADLHNSQFEDIDEYTAATT